MKDFEVGQLWIVGASFKTVKVVDVLQHLHEGKVVLFCDLDDPRPGGVWVLIEALS